MNEEKENTGIRFNEPATNLAIRHTTTNSSRKQQHSVYIHIKLILDCSGATSIIILHIFTLVTKYMAPTKKVKMAHKKRAPSEI